jgi:antitoxin ParD1/3/4
MNGGDNTGGRDVAGSTHGTAVICHLLAGIDRMGGWDGREGGMADMKTMNISLPETMKLYLDEQVLEGEYSSVSEYIRELVREDQRRTAQGELEEFLVRAIHSGEPEDITVGMLDEMRKMIRERGARRRAEG